MHIEVTHNQMEVRRGGENSFWVNGAIGWAVSMEEVEQGNSENAVRGTE